MSGIDYCLLHGADVIVNTDADLQYRSEDIPLLLKPLREGKADMVIGARPIRNHGEFSPAKKLLQRLGSWAVRIASRTRVEDAPSGFRAMTRECAMRLNVFNSYTYTLETLIQAGQSNLRVASVPICINPATRPSRLMRSIFAYVCRSAITIFRVFLLYRPLPLFFIPGGLLLLAGMIGASRFVWFYLTQGGSGHVQSVVFSAMCLMLAVLMFMMGVLADLSSTSRRLLEQVHVRVRRIEHAINRDIRR